jgi:hypothetical protein
VQYDEPIRTFLQVALALNKAVAQVKGIEPLLSTRTYDYGIETPSWDWREIGLKIEFVRSGLADIDPARVPYLTGLLDAFALMVRDGQGEKIPYARRVATYLQVPGERVAQEVIDGLKNELQQLLVEAGYPDDFGTALDQWREAQNVSGPEAERQGQQFLSRARAQTNLLVWPLPDGHKVELTFPTNYPYRGYSDYGKDYQGRVFLSGDIEWQLSSLKHVVTHEVFPGHQAQSAVLESTFCQGKMPVEGTLYFSNTPITPKIEGMCEIGQEAIGMMDDIDDQINDLYNRYTSAVSTNLAFDCNEGLMDKETAVQALSSATQVSRLFAGKRYDFFTNPLWSTGFPHYWYGREFMRESYRLMQDHLPEFYRMVYTEPHTVATLRQTITAYLDKIEAA